MFHEQSVLRFQMRAQTIAAQGHRGRARMRKQVAKMAAHQQQHQSSSEDNTYSVSHYKLLV